MCEFLVLYQLLAEAYGWARPLSKHIALSKSHSNGIPVYGKVLLCEAKMQPI